MKCENEVVVEHSKILALIPEMQNDIKVIREKLIDGNGKPGLLTRYEVLENDFIHHLDGHKDKNNDRKWFITIVITLLIGLSANLISLYAIYEKGNKNKNEIHTSAHTNIISSK
jgi:hypothetical protein